MRNIKEARRFFFREEIGSAVITVELNEVGWIHVQQFKGYGGLFGQSSNYAKLVLTTEDARNLISCLKKFVPDQESDPPKEPGHEE